MRTTSPTRIGPLTVVLFVGLFTAVWPAAAQPQEKPLQHFVMIFRSTRTLTPEERERRAGDLREWIGKVAAMGVTLNPRNLESRTLQISIVDGKQTETLRPVDPALITMVFFDATDWTQAQEIARLHPGPNYGSDLELREWATPTPLVH
jgi:hypothetical protein